MRQRLSVACLLATVLTLSAAGLGQAAELPRHRPGGGPGNGPAAGTSSRPQLQPGGYYSIYWPFEVCSAENPFCAGIEIINMRTGQGTFTSPVLNDYTPGPVAGWTPFGLTFDVDGTMYTLNNWTDLTSLGYARLARVNVVTGELTYIGPVHEMNFAGPEMDACGNFYATGFTVGDPADPLDTPLLFGDSFLYRFDKYTGEKTLIGDTGRTDWMDLDFDSQGRLWATTENKLYILDTQTGAATFVTDIHGVPNTDIPGTCEADWPYMEVMSIAFDEHDVLWSTAMRGFSMCWDVNTPVLTIDVNTGMATLVGYTNQVYNHGGDIMPKMVRVAHRRPGGGYTCISIHLNDLPAHLAHGDYVPGTNGKACTCP